MLEITRSLARTLASVLRRCYRKASQVPAMTISTDTTGLHLRTVHHEVCVEFTQVGNFPTSQLRIPIDAVLAGQGRDDSPVRLESASSDQVVVRWHDAGIPQAMTFPVPTGTRPAAFPDLPETFTTCPARFLTALDVAASVAATSATRYALDRAQIRGAAGQVVGTDSKQLVVESGFEFGFAENVLVPRLSVFSSPEFSDLETIQMGTTKTHLAIVIGPWRFLLTIDTAGRFPDFEAIIPRRSKATTVCQLAAEDGEFVRRTLPRLPGHDAASKPVTLDLNGQVCLRAQSEDKSATTELVLARTAYTGPPLKVHLNRDYLAQALQWNLTELQIHHPDRPLVCRDDRRTYVIMPLDHRQAIGPTESALRLNSSDIASAPTKIATPPTKESTMAKTSTNSNGSGASSHATPPANNRIGLAALVNEAQALRESARQTFQLASQLLGGLKRQRHQSKLVATTLASLKQLQTIDG